MAPGSGYVGGFSCRVLPECRGFVSREAFGPFRGEILGATGSPNPCGTEPGLRERVQRLSAFGRVCVSRLVCHASSKCRGFVSRVTPNWVRFVARKTDDPHSEARACPARVWRIRGTRELGDIWEFFPRVAESNNYRSRFLSSPGLFVVLPAALIGDWFSAPFSGEQSHGPFSRDTVSRFRPEADSAR